MLSPFEVAINSFVVLLLPLALHSLITRRLPPEGMLFGRLYRAERYLPLVSDLFLLTLCVISITRLGLHFGLIDHGLAGSIEPIVTVPFLILLALYLGLLVKAGLKLRRSANSGS